MPTATPPVPGSGIIRAKVRLVYEIPGADDLVASHPLRPVSGDPDAVAEHAKAALSALADAGLLDR